MLNIPQLDYRPESVEANAELIRLARAQLKAAEGILNGLEVANVAICKHPKTRDHYDPGYAGGGYDYTSCLVCGGRVR